MDRRAIYDMNIILAIILGLAVFVGIIWVVMLVVRFLMDDII